MPELTSVKMRISGLIGKSGSSYGRARPSSDAPIPSALRAR
jgi:hypothetical protein